MFSIKFQRNGLGKIKIDEFEESFESEHNFWNQTEYEKQWKSAIERTKSGFPAMFITSMSDPQYANFIRTWVCYPVKDEFVFQEWIVFLHELEGTFDIKNPHKHIGMYENISEDSDKISEWRTKEL